jgi:heme/copper-type cytochrome/quinol oxidase subunit 2
MVDVTPFGVLFVASCCIGVVGVIVLVALLLFAFVPRRSRTAGSDPRKADGNA